MMLSPLNRVLDRVIVAVIRAESPDLLVDVAEALVAGGVEVMEVAFTVPRAVQVLEQVAAKLGNRILLGAGTVLDPETRGRRFSRGRSLLFRQRPIRRSSKCAAAIASWRCLAR
jgi:2-keto-3-deoxy-6-phosphogluconate aldolase